MESEKKNCYTPIQHFYSGQKILITGGTGFVGKVLIEKLLRSCTDISKIYVLVRGKKGVEANQRVDELFNELVFQRLQKEVPNFRDKIVAITGDCASNGLDLSQADREMLQQEVTIVFHVAATVKFNDTIKNAVIVNVQGTKEMLELAKTMKHLMSIVHVSTAYSNCNRPVIDEKFYDSVITPDELIQLVNNNENHNLNALEKKIIEGFANVYTFTKQITEQLIKKDGADLPIGVFRPAIIISTMSEPIEGYVDNANGPIGALIGSAVGLLKIISFDYNGTAEVVPIDYAVNSLISIAWDVAENRNIKKDPPIYNYNSRWTNRITWLRFMTIALKKGKKYPYKKAFWCYNTTCVRHYIFYYILSIMLQIIPGIIIDTGLFLTRQQPRMLKEYKKMHTYISAVSIFINKRWKFVNQNTQDLWHRMAPEDQQMFYFSMADFNWEKYLDHCMRGLKSYMTREDLKALSIDLKRASKIMLLNHLINYLLIGIIIYFTYLLYNYVFMKLVLLQGLMSKVELNLIKAN